MKSFTWPQVNAWRLSQHFLSRRLEKQDFVSAVTNTGGIQAQVMSAAEMAIGVRVDDLSPENVQAALWQDRTLVKTWAMRGTLHLLAAEDLPLYAAANSVYESQLGLKYFTYYELTPAHYDAFMAAVPEVLGSEPMTRDEIAAAVAKHIGVPELGDILLSSSWGTPFKNSAFRGDLCFGPNRGRNITYVRPQKWIGKWKTLEPYPALQEIARRYLRAYGPGRPETFVRWWWGGSGITQAKKLFQSIEDELKAVEVEGWQAFALRSTLDAMESTDASRVVRLLPLFDAYTLTLGKDMGPLIPDKYLSLVFRPQGWITAAVLVDGYVQGVWEYKSKPSAAIIKVRMFSPPKSPVRKEIEVEAEQLGAFWNTKVVLEWEIV